MAKAESTGQSIECLNIDFMRSLVKQYSELGQWTSALFWADAAAAAGSGNGSPSGDDIWLLASVMLSRGELHRAAHAVTSRGLHRRHLLCLGVAMRAYLSAREPATALTMMEECDPALLEPRTTDQTHNRALAGVLVWQARALWALERREAGAAALCAALRADCACYEALELLLERHALPPAQETELIESLSLSSQLSGPEAALVRAAYRERLNRYAAPAIEPSPEPTCPMVSEVETCRLRTSEAAICRARRLAAGCEWAAALKLLDTVDPWCCGEVRAACLVELKKSSELFAFAHTLVDAYPNSWISWFAVGCYYYLIGKNEFARRYLSKAKGLEAGAGCAWLAYGHSFAADSEHDQAMAAYFKASQLMGGCHLPPLYVGVECSLLNNSAMCERFLARAAALHSNAEASLDKMVERSDGKAHWARLVPLAHEPHVAHEAGAAAFAAGDYSAAHQLFLRALHAAQGGREPAQLSSRWAATLDALGHTSRRLGRIDDAVSWHGRALALRPARSASLASLGLALALQGQEIDASSALHAALARDPDNVVALALLDAIVDTLSTENLEDEIQQFPFPAVNISLPAPATPAPAPADATNTSDMSMSFD
ncbi:cell division cycle protein 16 homolog [Ostrinia furnacalis]|uniref:cell division cycle protein 16 homolog n=1 Tax=Ostrinia furnacalis TaxID=93504 RepID=UPI0010407BC7|nr:cell division cycle protein 16 homolog [Ostrinia furnacalis]